MANTVIVALPEENDYVNKISTEEKPHLTVMYLGENLPEEHFPAVALYLQHVAKTSMHRFGLSVDRRGTLGPKDADVLFFEDGWQTREIKQIQAWLRADENINTAYHLSKQFASWIPHLTLGYPDSPAKEDTRDYPSLNYISFDRIAIWNGNYEGPEFRLKGYEDSLSEVAMRDTTDLGSSFTEYFMNEEILKHYGVAGMQWGKRKAGTRGGTPPSDVTPKSRGLLRRGATKVVGDVKHDNLDDDVLARFNELGLSLDEEFKMVVPEDLLHSEEFIEFVLDGELDELALAHYGIKGMRWGVRSTKTPSGVALKSSPGRKVTATGGKYEKPSADAERTAKQKQIAKKSSTDALSNAELKQMIERMNLESQYERLATQSRGSGMVKKMFSEPKYRNQQIEGIQKLTMPLKVGAGAAATAIGVRNAIKRTDLSNLLDD